MREPSNYEAPLCAQVGGNYWFPENDGNDNFEISHIRMAKSICRKCQHQSECAEWGIQNEKFGIWGGITENERRYIRRARRLGDKGIA